MVRTMKVSQLLHTIDRDDCVAIDDKNAPIDRNRIYDGTVRGIRKDDPINKMHVLCVFAADDKIHILEEAVYVKKN